MDSTAPSYGKPGTIDHGFSKISLTVKGKHVPDKEGKGFLHISADALTAACGVGCVDHCNIDGFLLKSASTSMGENVDFVGTVKGGNKTDIVEPTVTPRCHVLDGNRMRSGHFTFSGHDPAIDQVIPINTAENRRDENLAAGYRGAVLAGDVRAMKSGDKKALNKGILCVENHISTTGTTERKFLVPVDDTSAGPIATTFNQHRLDPEIVFFDDKYHPENALIVDATSDGSSEGMTKKYVVVAEDDHEAHKSAVHELLTPSGTLAKLNGIGISTMASDPRASGDIRYNLEIHRTPITGDGVMAPELAATGVFDHDDAPHPRVDVGALKAAFNAEEGLVATSANEPTINSIFGAGTGKISVVNSE